MVVGQNPKGDDIEINVCKRKQLTNTRASGSDDALKLTPPKILSLEQALDFIEMTSLWRSHQRISASAKRFLIRKCVCAPTENKRPDRMPARAGTSGLRLCSGRCQARAAGTQHRPPGRTTTKSSSFCETAAFCITSVRFVSHLFFFVTSVRFRHICSFCVIAGKGYHCI